MAHSKSGIRMIKRKASRADTATATTTCDAFDASPLREALRQVVPFGWLSADANVALAGEIRQAGALADIVAFLAQSGRTGTLIVANDEGVRTLGVDKGDLVFVTTTVARERIGELIHQTTAVPHDDIDVASVLAAIDGRPLGEVLVSEGHVERGALEALLLKQAEDIFFTSVRLEACIFAFVDVPLCPPRMSARPSLLGLLLEGARRADEAAAISDDAEAVA